MVKAATCEDNLADFRELIGMLFCECDDSSLAVDRVHPKTTDDDCTVVDIWVYIGGVRVARLDVVGADTPLPQVICRDTEHEWPMRGGAGWRVLMWEVLDTAKQAID